MAIEKDIQALTAAIVGLTTALSGRAAPSHVAPGSDTIVAQAPAVTTIVPPAAPAMPPVPFPGTPAGPSFGLPPPVAEAPAAPAATARPFNDVQGCAAWVVSRFHALGAAKGQAIQAILAELGITNIQNVQPAQFDALYARVGALG